MFAIALIISDVTPSALDPPLAYMQSTTHLRI